ncbi:hypothetical protein BJ742DRAFT_793534 [Cladochytrium replicatum]|nr:hypothetical protein BJ742DRAFT_793534 [Cladochytrium replicatum]
MAIIPHPCPINPAVETSSDSDTIPMRKGTQSTSTPTNSAALGVRLTYLDEFVSSCGGRASLKSLTTLEVVARFIRPKTTRLTSLVHSIAASPTTPRPVLGPATWFVSHVWNQPFLELVDAISGFFGGAVWGTFATPKTVSDSTPREDVVLWIDIFCLPQSDPTAKSADWYLDQFPSIVQTIPNTLLILSLPTNERTSLVLRRTWCLYELYLQISNNRRIDVALPPNDAAKFLKDVDASVDEWVKRIAPSVRISSSETSLPGDRSGIISALCTVTRDNEKATCNLVDGAVSKALNMWLTRTLKSNVSSDSGFESGEEETKVTKEQTRARWMVTLARVYFDQADFQAAEPMLKAGQDKLSRLLGPAHPEVLIAQHNRASALSSLGRYDEAEAIIKDCIAKRTRKGQPDDQLLTSMHALAVVYLSAGRYADAEASLRGCVDKMTRHLGPVHTETLSAQHNLASLLSEVGKMEEGERLYRQVITRRTQVFGADHHATLSSLQSFSTMLIAAKRYEEAETLLKDVLARKSALYGNESSSTASTRMHLVTLYIALERHTDAEAVLKQYLNAQTQALGSEHPDTLLTKFELASLYASEASLPTTHNAASKWAEAEYLFRACRYGQAKVLGVDAVPTIASTHNLAWVLHAEGRFPEAYELYQDSIERMCAVVGPEHADTIALMGNLAAVCTSMGRTQEAESLLRDVSKLEHRARDRPELELWEVDRIPDGMVFGKPLHIGGTSSRRKRHTRNHSSGFSISTLKWKFGKNEFRLQPIMQQK